MTGRERMQPSLIQRLRNKKTRLVHEGSHETDSEIAFIHAHQVELLYRNFSAAAIASLLTASIFVVAMWNMASHTALVLWLTAMYLATAMRAWGVFQYRRRAKASHVFSTDYWENRFAWSSSTAAALWGLMVILFTPEKDPVALSLILLTVSGVSAAAGALLASSSRAVVLFLLLVLLPTAVVLLSYGDRAHLFMTASIVTYLAVLLDAVRRRQALMVDSLRTGMENERLQGKLRAEKMLAEEREKTVAQLAKFETESQYREIFENITDGLLLLDIDHEDRFRVAGCNPAFMGLVGLDSQSDVDEVGLAQLLPPQASRQIMPHFEQCFENKRAIRTDLLIEQGGEARVLEIAIIPIFSQEGECQRMVGIARDMTERKQMETLLYEREQAFRHLVQNSPDVILRYDTQCRRIFGNNAYNRAIGGEVKLGMTPLENWGLPTPYSEVVNYQTHLQAILASGEPEIWELRWQGRDGLTMCYTVHGVPEFDRQGQVTSALVFARDISERVRLEEELQHQASYDALTGLPNRRMFSDRLQEEMARCARNSLQLGLLFIDLDRFKEINDSLGHEAGDLVLQQTAKRIISCMRGSDLLARLGGDEFVILLPELPDISILGRLSQAIIESLTKSFELQTQTIYLSASIGIAGYPVDAQTAEELLASADQAMYAAKQSGKNTFCFFTQEMQKSAQARMRLLQDLRTALAEGQLSVQFQPIVCYATGQVTKAELLLRWHHPELGYVSPAEFIPLAEETGLIHDIGNWVFRQAIVMTMDWQMQAMRLDTEQFPRQVSVNISPRQFAREGVEDAWIDYLRAMDVAPSSVVIEITEGLLMNEQFDISSRLQKLHDAGIQVALDDFGTGYSAMAYLKRFNIDYLKIDRSFVCDIDCDSSDRAIVEAIVAMAHRLGLETIAEGVETVEQREALAQMGCEFLQGYLYAKPMSGEAFLDFVASTHRANCNHSGEHAF